MDEQILRKNKFKIINQKPKSKMKNFKKLRIALTLALMVVGMTTALAQNLVPTPDGDLYLNGRNVSSPGANVVAENPDLITNGTKVPYLVIPDATLNPTWSAAAALDATVTTGITSTFTWTVTGAFGALNAAPVNTGHYIHVDVTAAAGTLGTLNVKEQGAVGCPDITGTNISIKVVAKPAATALAVSDGVAPNVSICVSGTNGSLNVAFPTFTATKTYDASIDATGDPLIMVKATLVFNDFVLGTPTTLFTDQLLNVDATTGAISNADIATKSALTDFDKWGSYVLTITQISDKISRKDLNAAAGYFNINGVTGYAATYTVLKTAQTGAIYHLPNN